MNNFDTLLENFSSMIENLDNEIFLFGDSSYGYGYFISLTFNGDTIVLYLCEERNHGEIYSGVYSRTLLKDKEYQKNLLIFYIDLVKKDMQTWKEEILEEYNDTETQLNELLKSMEKDDE